MTDFNRFIKLDVALAPAEGNTIQAFEETKQIEQVNGQYTLVDGEDAADVANTVSFMESTNSAGTWYYEIKPNAHTTDADIAPSEWTTADLAEVTMERNKLGHIISQYGDSFGEKKTSLVAALKLFDENLTFIKASIETATQGPADTPDAHAGDGEVTDIAPPSRSDDNWDVAPKTYTCDYLDGHAYEGVASVAFYTLTNGEGSDEEDTPAGYSMVIGLNPTHTNSPDALQDALGVPMKGKFEIVLPFSDDSAGNAAIYEVEEDGSRGDLVEDMAVIKQLHLILTGSYSITGLEGPQSWQDDNWINALGNDNGNTVQELIEQFNAAVESLALAQTPSTAQ